MVDSGSSFNAAVAAEFRAERGAKQLTVEQLAEQSGLVPGTLLRYLNGKRAIPIPALYYIAKALDVPPREIVVRAEKREASSKPTT